MKKHSKIAVIGCTSSGLSKATEIARLAANQTLHPPCVLDEICNSVKAEKRMSAQIPFFENKCNTSIEKIMSVHSDNVALKPLEDGVFISADNPQRTS